MAHSDTLCCAIGGACIATTLPLAKLYHLLMAILSLIDMM